MSLPPDAIANGELAARQRRERERARTPKILGTGGPREPIYIPPEGFRTCDNPLCRYLVPRSVAYCCLSCGLAHDHKFEIHEDGPLGHNGGCARRPR